MTTTGSRWRPFGTGVLALAVAAALGAALGAGPRPDGRDAARAQEQAAGDGNGGDGIVFLHALDDTPIGFTYRPEQEITEAVAAFHRTAENPYRDDPEAIAVGQKLYKQWCQACHLPDATGRIGPSLVDEEVRYPRVATDRGMFEVIYAGGAGAMQAFGQRIDQDEILKVMAFIDSLRG